MLKKSLAAFIVVLGLLATGCALRTVALMPDYPVPTDADDLMATASAVIVGEVRSSSVAMAGENGAGWAETHATVLVQRVVKGDISAGQSVDVAEMGGQYRLTNYTTPTGILLKKGRTYLLFLNEGDGATRYLIMEPSSSAYPFDSTGQLTIEPMNQWVTLDDVKQVTGL